jgi:hypothetical protein
MQLVWLTNSLCREARNLNRDELLSVVLLAFVCMLVFFICIYITSELSIFVKELLM